MTEHDRKQGQPRPEPQRQLPQPPPERLVKEDGERPRNPTPQPSRR